MSTGESGFFEKNPRLISRGRLMGLRKAINLRLAIQTKLASRWIDYWQALPFPSRVKTCFLQLQMGSAA